ncbi:CTAG/Pcc1 family [Pelagophyceae sp. CCMP2097]|nr:CTAG/Pcc1 family [Pelagophyceae sp. CCMP2097]
MAAAYEGSIVVEFASSREATIALNSLVVDGELQPQQVTRTLRTEESKLIIDFTAREAKMLRVSMGSFFDFLAVVAKTIDAFRE